MKTPNVKPNQSASGMVLRNLLEASKERPWLEAKKTTQIGIASAAMAMAGLGRTFRLAVPNKTAATTSPARNAIKSTADCCVMQYLSSHQSPRADVRPRKKMAAAKRRARLPGLAQCRNALGPSGAWPPGRQVPIPQWTARAPQQMQSRPSIESCAGALSRYDAQESQAPGHSNPASLVQVNSCNPRIVRAVSSR